LRAQGIKATQFTLLALLSLKGPQPIGALAEFLDADRTTLTRNIQVAAGLGLVSIAPGEDARARIVSVTVQGRQVLKRAFPIWRKVQAQLTDTMGKEAADSLRRLSDRPSQRRPKGTRSLET
jgi:DNA-binding MarR family transcriptional regulator